MTLIYWVLFGSVFNLIYFGFGLDHFIVKVTLLNIKDVEDKYKEVIDVKTEERLKALKDNCASYEGNVNHNLITVIVDLLIYPLYMGALFLALIDYLILKKNRDAK